MLRTLPLLLAAPALPAIAQAPAAPIPIESFVKQEQFSQPRLSPDGKHLAVTVRMPIGARDVPTMTFYSLPDLKIESVVRLPAFQVPLGYYWVSNTRLVVRKGHEQGSREIPTSYGEVLAMEYDGKKQEYLYGYDRFQNSARTSGYQDDYGYAYVSDIPAERNGRVFLSAYLWDADFSELLEIDTVKGKRRSVARVPHSRFNFYVQNDGQPRFAVGSDDNAQFALLRREGDSGKWTRVPQEKTGTLLDPFAFSADDREFMAWHSERGGPQVLVRENLATGARHVVASHADGSVSDAMFGSRRYLPIAAFTSVGKPEVRYVEPDSHADVALHKQLAAQFPGDVVRFLDVTQDGGKVLFVVRSDRDPGTYYLFDRKNGRADMLFAAMESLEPDQMAERKPVSFKARDGLQLHGYLTVPRQPAAGKLPLVLIPHGGPHGPYDSWYFDTDAQFLASRGYAVLQVNFRGSGGRGETFEAAGYRQWHGKIMDDLVDGVRWAVGNAGVDSNRMCVFGASFGGYAAMTLASREPGLFKCAVGYAGAYDLKLLLEGDDVKRSKTFTSYWRRYIGDDVKELDRISPALHADTIKAPVLLIHGGKDKITPKEHAFRMRDALAKAGRPPEWYYVDYEWHGFYDTENQVEVYRRLETFLAKHLRR
ncbi:alpha/beta hydrolase family protein [Pseudoduganella umbonata]|uniref:Dipeptidyl aminopeptidase/acylaminoacyl peptidase n=1 Tax=Pseudoduganella umbonata TaxID=864828 RepID=A0A4V1EDG8_9BURK|nr:alpha/beta fold hydrolase [Pseudoduganella umbonata]MBB3224713.1 dipeptidyl aminopeptidase/acylaminoacyl peptidase [Pseudoduganella umbonata]QCP11031.1 S9 family peptidase [Pseudoduganella umbonata]